MKSARDVTRVERPRSDARLVVDANGQIRVANQGAHRLLAYADGSLVGLSLAWLMPPSRHEKLAQLSRAHKDAKTLCLQSVLIREDGSLVSVVMSTQPCVDTEGQELTLTLELDEEPTVGAPRSAHEHFPATERSGMTTMPPPDYAKVRIGTNQPTRLSARPPAGTPLSRGRAAKLATTAGGFTPRPASPTDVAAQLSACSELVSWLDLQLQRHDGDARHEFVRDRAVARVVLQELSTLLENCRATLAR
jgi:PAS domain S-box-containing protein